MDSEPKDFKAVKVQLKASQKQGEALSRSMLYSGINIFGQLSQQYLQNRSNPWSTNETLEKPSAKFQTADAGSMMNISQEVLAIFKRLQKKDSTTKIKAFQELDKYVDAIDPSQQQQDDSQTDEIQNLLTFFLYHFCRIIMNEPDKKVREAAHVSLSIFIKKAKRRLGPHLKRIFSLWYCSFFDTSQEVAAIARKNFENAFPEGKRDQVFKISYKNFLHFANEQLKQSEDAITESNADLSKAQREDVFDRITSSVLQALAKSFDFIKDWNEDEKEHFKKKLIDILDLNVPIIESNDLEKPSEEVKDKKQVQQQKVAKKQQPQSYLWGFLQPKYRGRVRASCLLFISNLLLNLPKEIVDTHISQLAPLVYGLVGEDNSSLQGTLWREALFTLGKNFPNSWESINIKKNFQPKLYQALKAAGFGSPVALYDNFVKFVSIFPFYHLVDYVEDKQNKASFKERCNLIRETFTNLYAGLKNDESVAFHQDLVKSYFETLTFMIWKRLQPLIQNEKISHEDKEFAMGQIKKCVQLPLDDYINNFDKFMSKVQNQRNIRVTIPSQLAKMLKDLAERNIDENIFQNIAEYINESIILGLDKVNTVRSLDAILKIDMNRDSRYFRHILIEQIVMKYVHVLTQKTNEDIDNLGKENIEGLNKKIQNLYKIIYRVNKHQIKLEHKAIDVQQLYDVFNKITKKEDMAKNVLTADILNKFKLLKDNILKSIILSFNLGQQTEMISTFVMNLLQSQTLDISLKIKLLLPILDIKKVDFTQYFTNLNNQEAHKIVIDFIVNNIINDAKQISNTYQLIDQGITQLQQGKPSFILKDDFNIISERILDKIKALDQDFSVISYYFSAVKNLINLSEDTAFDSLKQLLFDKLLQIKPSNHNFQKIWNIYAHALQAHLKTKQETGFYKYCLEKLKQELHTIIHVNSNYEIDSFNRFTLIVKQFVSLCHDKQQIIEEILLQEVNFNNLENNSLPLKIFRDLFLSGGIGFDVTRLFTSSQYIWLASILLNIRHLPSLANFIQHKKQLVIFVDTEVIPVLINQAQNGNSKIILDIFENLGKLSKESMDYVYTIEYFLKKMIDPGEDFPSDEKPILKIEEFKQIFKKINEETIQHFLKNDNLEYNLEVLTFIKILKQTSYYIMDENIVQEIFQKSAQTLQSHLINQKTILDQLFAIALEIYQALFDYLGTTLKENISQELLITLLQNSQKLSDDTNVLNAALQYISYILNKLGVSQFNQIVSQKINFQNFITQIIEIEQNKHLQPLTQIHLLSIIRKTIAGELINDKQQLIDQVIEIAKHQALAFDMKLQKIQENLAKEMKDNVVFQEEVKQQSDDSFEEDQIEDFEYEMLQDIAETLIIFPAYLQPTINENNLYILISSGIESLQKAAFILLKYLYENYIPILQFPVDEEEVAKQLMVESQEAEKQQQQEQQSEEEKKQQEIASQQKYKNKLAFKNISEILIELIENPPNISNEGEQQQIVSGTTQVEALIFGENQEGCMNSKVFGYFLAWNALLIKIENGRIKSQIQQVQDYSTVLGALNEYLEENDSIYRMLLVSLLAYLPEEKRGLADAYNVNRFEPEYFDLTDKKQNALYIVYTLINFMKSFPSLARKYYSECEKQLLDLVMPYIKQIVSPAILENEIKKIEVAQSQMGQNELTFALFKSTKEILANFTKGEIEMTLKIKIPPDYPLKLVEVDVSRQIKISEKQMRKWILAIRKIIQFQNGDIISAVLVWKNNIEKEIEGIEDCYICYCVVHESDQSLPKMPCKTCKNKFHVACIRKWFRQSHKSNCPICQNYFF